jgi:hypothetical protein
VSVPELKFLGLIINMGLISLPGIKHYWSSEKEERLNFLVTMSRDHFLQKMWMMHVGK